MQVFIKTLRLASNQSDHNVRRDVFGMFYRERKMCFSILNIHNIMMSYRHFENIDKLFHRSLMETQLVNKGLLLISSFFYK